MVKNMTCLILIITPLLILLAADNAVTLDESEENNVKKNTIKIFAQSDVIESFFNGINETLLQDISENINFYAYVLTLKDGVEIFKENDY